jgi:diguanylate cyclase (GGDEF)-like protein
MEIAVQQQPMDERDRDGDERDRLAETRDRQAESRRREADDRDDEVIDIRDGSALAVLRDGAGADRRDAAADRAGAATDRKHAELDRLVAAHERGDANEERAILQTDALTGLMQRGVGLSALEREAARSSRTGETFVVAFIDVDGLKQTNDEHGHAGGDALLRALGLALRASMRSYDLALRYGGDEFVCILPGFRIGAARTRFAHLQATLAAGSPPVSVTFGVAEWRAGEDTAALLARADAALYDVRGTERNAESADTAVAAHGLLNSSAVVSLGIGTLQANWDALSGADRARLLERMHVHSSSIGDRLREITQGR